MSELLIFIYLAGLLVIGGWVMQIGAHPNSSRTAFAAIVIVSGIMLAAGACIFTMLSLFIMAVSN